MNILKIIFTICLIKSIYCSGFGQVIYFSKPIDNQINNPSAEFDKSVIALKDGYVVLSGTQFDLSSIFFRVYKTDKYGDLIWERKYGQSNHFYYTKEIIKDSDSTYMICSTSDPPMALYDYCLFKINNSGDSLWLKIYGDTTKEICEGVIHTRDNGYAMIGNRIHQTKVSSQILLIKTDSNGNKLWEREYGGNYYDKGYGIVQLDDGGFMISGYTSQFINNNLTDRDAIIIRTDSLGYPIWSNQQWSRQFPGKYFDWSGYIVKSMEGGVLTSGSFNNLHLPRNPPQTPLEINNYMGLVVKWTDNGIVEWSGYYGPDSNYVSGLTKIIQLADTSYVITGGQDIQYWVGEDMHTMGWLIKIDKKGKKIWSRTFTMDTTADHYTWDVDLAPDNGFILCGSSFSNPNSTDQDGWLLKVDSMGCLIPGCDTIRTGINPTQHISLSGILLYPNPTDGPLLVDFSTLKNEIPQRLELIDINGRVLINNKIDMGEDVYYLDLSEFPPGMYILSVYDNKKILGISKLLVQ
jgi:Secretion system C-terminal sorting domain